MSSKRILTEYIQTGDVKRHWLVLTLLLTVIGCMCMMLPVSVFGKSLGLATSEQMQSTHVDWVVPVDENSAVNLDQRFANTSNSVFYLDEGKLFSKDIKSGRLNWQSGQELRSAILYIGEFLITGSQSNIFAFSPLTGKIIWQMKSKGSIKFFKLIGGSIIAFYTNSKFGLSNYNIKTGKLLWSSSGYDYNLELNFYKIIDNFLLLYGRTDGHVFGEYTYCIDTISGKILWKREGKPVYTEKNRIIVVKNPQGRWITGNLPLILRTFDYQRGLEIAEKTLITVDINDLSVVPPNSVDRFSQFNIWANDKKLWIYTASGYLSRLENRNLDNIQQINSRQDASGQDEWIVIKNDRYSFGVKTKSREVYGLDLNKPIFSISERRGESFGVFLSEDRIFVIYQDGTVYCFDFDGKIVNITSFLLKSQEFVYSIRKISKDTYIVSLSSRIGVLKI